MTIDPKNEKHLIADEGKVLARISNMNETYKEVWLGYHLVNGIKKEDTAKNFIEITPKKKTN